MRSKIFAFAALVAATSASIATAAPAATSVDIKRAAPKDASFAIYAKENEERAYQQEYLEEAWQTFQKERIGERIVEIIASHAPKGEMEKAEEVWDEVKEAASPIDWDAVAGADEFVYAQQMTGPFQHYVVALRLSEDDAENFQKGITQLFDLLEERSEGKVSVKNSEVGDTTVTTLTLPEKSPYHPCVARVGDVALVCSNPAMLTAAIEQLEDESGESKFDDPRVVAALKELPEPEDVLMFFDGKQLFDDLGGISEMIRKEHPGDENAERGAKIIDDVLDQIAIFDNEVCVEYTEDGQNRVAAIGQLSDGFEDKLLGKALAQGEPFEDWESWIPADATAYSLGTGINLHVLYEGVMNWVRDEFPESHKGLDHFAEIQDDVGVHLDEDILQSFSGEYVSVSLGEKGAQQVTALRCSNPDRIRELLKMGFEKLSAIPQAQDVKLEDCEDLEGFMEVKAGLLEMAKVTPVIGFHDGWMIVASHREAAEKLIAVRAGDEDSIKENDPLEKYGIEVEGETYSVRFSDIGAGVRQAADIIDQIGTTAPMFIGMAGAQAKPEQMKPVMEALGLLPSVAKVVRKFDFLEHQFSIVHEGPEANTYRRESVTEIRQAEGN